MEEEKKEHELKMKKMEAEMEQVFEMKVKEKKQKLKDSEVEMSRRHDERKKVSAGQSGELQESQFNCISLRSSNWRDKCESWMSGAGRSSRRRRTGRSTTA